jgi:Ran GTPase-activating protein (RanGAP) involved in mRNA processing and transport
MTAISQNTSWSCLEELDLSSNHIKSEGANALMKNAVWTHLKFLNLTNNQLEESGAEALSKNVTWTNLRSLNLSGNKLGDQGAALVSKKHILESSQEIIFEFQPDWRQWNGSHLLQYNLE